MKGEFIFDTKDLIIMKDRYEEVFYAIDREKFNEAENNYSDQLRTTGTTQQAIVIPELEVRLLVEKENRKFDIGTTHKVVSFERLKGVLIPCN